MEKICYKKFYVSIYIYNSIYNSIYIYNLFIEFLFIYYYYYYYYYYYCIAVFSSLQSKDEEVTKLRNDFERQAKGNRRK